MKRIASIVLTAFALLCLSISSCGNNKKEVLSKVPIKNEIMGIKLGEEASRSEIENAFSTAIGMDFRSYEQEQEKGKLIRTSTSIWYFLYGGGAWTYADILLDEKNRVKDIEFTFSNKENESAENQFEVLKASLVQKYGEYNIRQAPDKFKSLLKWTDGVTSIGLSYYEGRALNGENRFFCTLFYVDDVLANPYSEQKAADL